MIKISKREGTRTYIHDENPERREKSPNWKFSSEFIKTLKSQLLKNQLLEQDEEARILAKFFESVKKKQELESEQIAEKLEDEKELNR